ncbi:hypothetical protein [Zavarzinia sp.]|uniref:hypothetical protein n=1 Tax=Zavarzinia sp. TaxID=2027920 RepID=UPI003BB4FD89
MSAISSVSGAQATQSLFSKLDANGDGKVSQDEFVTGRPRETSESDAASLYAKIDEEGTGAPSEDQLKAGLDANRPPPPAFTGGAPSLSSDLVSALIDVLQQSGEEETTTSTSTTTTADASATDAAKADAAGTTTTLSGDLLASLYKAIQAYASTNNITLDSTSPTVNSVG